MIGFRELWQAVSDALAVPPQYDPQFARAMQAIHARGYEARRQMDIRAATAIQDMQEAASEVEWEWAIVNP